MLRQVKKLMDDFNNNIMIRMDVTIRVLGVSCVNFIVVVQDILKTIGLVIQVRMREIETVYLKVIVIVSMVRVLMLQVHHL